MIQICESQQAFATLFSCRRQGLELVGSSHASCALQVITQPSMGVAYKLLKSQDAGPQLLLVTLVTAAQK